MDFGSLRDAAQRTMLSLPHGPCGRGKLTLPRQGADTNNADCEAGVVVVDGMDLIVVQAKAVAAARGSRAEAARFTEHFLAEASRQAENDADLQDGFRLSVIAATNSFGRGLKSAALLKRSLDRPVKVGLWPTFTSDSASHRLDRQSGGQQAGTVLLHLLDSKLPGGNLGPLALRTSVRRQRGQLGWSAYLFGVLACRDSGDSLLDVKAALWQRQLESVYLLLRSRYTKSARQLPLGNVVAGPSGFGNGSETDRLTTACGLTRRSVPLIPRAPGTDARALGCAA